MNINDQFARQTEQFFRAAQDARMPENIQAFAQDSLTKTRAAFDKMSATAKDSAKVLETATIEAQSGAKALSEKVYANVRTNTEAAFDAAHAIVQAKSLPEAAKLQADFFQAQIAKASEQTREFLELSAKMTKGAFEAFGAVAANGFQKPKASR